MAAFVASRVGRQEEGRVFDVVSEGGGDDGEQQYEHWQHLWNAIFCRKNVTKSSKVPSRLEQGMPIVSSRILEDPVKKFTSTAYRFIPGIALVPFEVRRSIGAIPSLSCRQPAFACFLYAAYGRMALGNDCAFGRNPMQKDNGKECFSKRALAIMVSTDFHAETHARNNKKKLGRVLVVLVSYGRSKK